MYDTVKKQNISLISNKEIYFHIPINVSHYFYSRRFDQSNGWVTLYIV